VLTIDFGEARAVDAVGLAGHNLGGSVVTIGGATDPGLTTWVELTEVTPTDDATLLALFSAQTLYAVRIEVVPAVEVVATKISVAYAGQALAMPVPGYRSLGPVDLGMDVITNTYRTENGQLAGRFIHYTGLRGSVVFSHLPESWVRQVLMPVIKEMIRKPFFLANRPSGYPDDCSFAWTSQVVIPTRSGPKSYMQVQMEVNAHAPSSLF
jgi:hypothetical protein